jgi:cytochrome c peroxidase
MIRGRHAAIATFLAAGAAMGMFACGTSATHDGSVPNRRPVHLVRPATSPLSAMALLGRAIFYDSSLSATGRLSCASCHRPDNAYGPSAGQTVGTANGIVRSVPSLSYADRAPAFGIGLTMSDADEVPTSAPVAGSSDAKVAGAQRPDSLVARGGLFWDGRVNTLQDQAMGPLFNPSEMGQRDVASVRDRLRAASYAKSFVTLFGGRIFDEPLRLVDEAMFAVARYEIEDPSFHPYDSKYDAYLEGSAPLTAAEWRGLQAFEDPKRGNCAACHPSGARSDGRPPAFTDFEYEALGVPAGTTAAVDLGACGPLRRDLEAQTQFCGLFRTPSLRNTATRTAYFHNGAFQTLDQVVVFYAFRDTRPELAYRGQPSSLPKAYSANLDTTDAPFGRRRGQPAMTEQDMRDIVAFLRTLTDGFAPPVSNHSRPPGI